MSLDGAKLICLDEHGVKGKEIEAKGTKFTIGYYIDSDYILQDSRAQSTHCEILCDPWSRVTIHNKSTEYPVQVNGQNVDIKQALYTDSHITILDQTFLWQFISKCQNSDFEEMPLQEVESTTPAKQEETKPASYSCPDLRFHREVAKRLTVHNFAYSIPHDEEGNISSDLEYSNSDIAAETSKDATVCDTTTVESKDEPKSRSVTPELFNQTQNTKLLNATNNKTTKSTDKKKHLSFCQMSELLVTSYAPRETGVRIEKSFTALLKPMTPQSVYSTPNSTVDYSVAHERSHALINFATPATSKKGLEQNSSTSSMHLVDLTTPKKFAPSSPMPKSALKSFSKYTPAQLGAKQLPAVVVSSASNTRSNGSATSVQSSDISEVVELSSDDCSSGVLQTPSKATSSMAKLATPKRTPQSLIKRVLLTSAKKHVAKNNPQQSVERNSREAKSILFASSPMRKNVQLVGLSNDDSPSTSFMARARLMNTQADSFVSTSTPLAVQREQKFLHGVRKNFGNVTIAGHINRNRSLNKSAQLVTKARKSLNSLSTASESKRLSSGMRRPAVVKAFKKSLGSRHDMSNQTFILDASTKSNLDGTDHKKVTEDECLLHTTDDEDEVADDADGKNNEEVLLNDKVDLTHSNDKLSPLSETLGGVITKDHINLTCGERGVDEVVMDGAESENNEEEEKLLEENDTKEHKKLTSGEESLVQSTNEEYPLLQEYEKNRTSDLFENVDGENNEKEEEKVLDENDTKEHKKLISGEESLVQSTDEEYPLLQEYEQNRASDLLENVDGQNNEEEEEKALDENDTKEHKKLTSGEESLVHSTDEEYPLLQNRASDLLENVDGQNNEEEEEKALDENDTKEHKKLISGEQSLVHSTDEEYPLLQEYEQNRTSDLFENVDGEHTEKMLKNDEVKLTHDNDEFSALSEDLDENGPTADGEEEDNREMTKINTDDENEQNKQHASKEEEDIFEEEEEEKVMLESFQKNNHKGNMQEKVDNQQYYDEFEEELELLTVEQFLEDQIKECVENEVKKYANAIDEIQKYDENQEEEEKNFVPNETTLLLTDDENIKNHVKMQQNDVEFITANQAVDNSTPERETDNDLLEDIDYILNKSDDVKHKIENEEENYKNLINNDLDTANFQHIQTDNGGNSDDEIETAEHNGLHINKKEEKLNKTVENEMHADDEKENQSKVTTPNTPNMRGMRELLQTPKEAYAKTPHLSSYRHLLRTPKAQELNLSANLDGVQSLLSLSDDQTDRHTEISIKNSEEFNKAENMEDINETSINETTVKEQESVLPEAVDLESNNCDLNVTEDLDKTTDLIYISKLSENKLETSTVSELKASDIIVQAVDMDAENIKDLDENFLLHTPMQRKNADAGGHEEATSFTDSEFSKTDVQKWADAFEKDEVSAIKEIIENSKIITTKDGDSDDMSNKPDAIEIVLTKNSSNDMTQIKVQEKEHKEMDECSDHKSNKSDISDLLDQSIDFMDPLVITSSNSSIANACDDANVTDEEIPETQVTIMNNNDVENLNESCEIPETQLPISGKSTDNVDSTNEDVSTLSGTSLNSKEEPEELDDSYTVNTFGQTLENDVFNEVGDNDMAAVCTAIERKNIENENVVEDDDHSIEDGAEVALQFDSKLSNHSKSLSHFDASDQHFDEYDSNKEQQLDKSTNKITKKSLNAGSTEDNSKANLHNDDIEDANEISSLKKDSVQSENGLADLTDVDDVVKNDTKANTTHLLASQDIFDLEAQSTNSTAEQENGSNEQVNSQESTVTVQNSNESIKNSNELAISEEIALTSSTTNEENTISVMIEQENLATSQTQSSAALEIVEKLDNVVEDIANKDSCTSIEVEADMKLNVTELSTEHITAEVQQESDEVNSTVSNKDTVQEHEEVDKQLDSQKIDNNENEKVEKQNKDNAEEKVIVNKRVTRRKRNEVQKAPSTTAKKAKATKAAVEKLNVDAQNHEEAEIESNKVVGKLENQEKEVKPKRAARGKAKKLSLDTNVDQTEDSNKEKLENRKGETITVAKRAGRGRRKEIVEADDVNRKSPSVTDNSKPEQKIEVEKRVTRGKRKGQAQENNTLAPQAAAHDGTVSVVQSKAKNEDLEVSVVTNKSSADDEETIALPEENQSGLVSSRGRMRKPVAAVQQFIEEVRARSATPKRLKAQQSAFTSTPQSVARKPQLLLIPEVDSLTMPTDISAVLPETKESTLTRRTRRAATRGTSEEPKLVQNDSHTRRTRKTSNDGKDTLPLEASQSENVSRSLNRGAQNIESIQEESEPKKTMPRKRARKNTEESNEKKLSEEPVATEDNTTKPKPTVSKRIRKASVESMPEVLSSKRKAKENVETLETASVTAPQEARKTTRTRKAITKEEELKPELEAKVEKTTRSRRGAKNAKKMEEDETEAAAAIAENETAEEKPKPKSSKTKPSAASVAKSTNDAEKSATTSTRAQRGKKRQITEAPEEELKNATMDNSNTKQTRQTRGRKVVHFNSDNVVEQEKTEPSPPKRVTRARRGV